MRRARKTLNNAALVANIGVDTLENEPRKDREKGTIQTSP